MANKLLSVTLILWKGKNIIYLVIFLAQYPQHVNSFVILSKCLQNNTNYHFKSFSNMAASVHLNYGGKNAPQKNTFPSTIKRAKTNNKEQRNTVLGSAVPMTKYYRLSGFNISCSVLEVGCQDQG